MLLSRLTTCPFAVKGGGHAAFGGASNIEGGITVTMESLDQVSVASNKKTVDVGPGNRWVDVYTALEPFGVGVAGGRMAPVGVPGLILGGGYVVTLSPILTASSSKLESTSLLTKSVGHATMWQATKS